MTRTFSPEIRLATGADGYPPLPFEFDRDFDSEMLHRKSYYRVALLVPLCGSAGLWSPSCIACAQVAVEELNRDGGIDGRQVQLLMVDSAVEAPMPVEEIVNDLIETGAIDAIVGMHISAVRQRLSKIVRQRIPYIYTPLYEGGERTPGVFAIGETPGLQLRPAIDFLRDTYSVRKWALIGNDYVWPRASHSFAKQKLAELSASLVYERYLPFGLTDMARIVDEIEQSGADALLMSLVGQDAVIFNRAFGDAGLHNRMVRLSCAIEENGLLASGAAGLKRLYSSSSYFGALKTEANAAFREKYHGMHGGNAPVLNTLGQSTYEGMHCLADIMEQFSDDWRDCSREYALQSGYRSARRNPHQIARGQATPMYIARADGMCFDIVKSI